MTQHTLPLQANRQVHTVKLRDIVEIDWASYAPETVTLGLRHTQEWGRFGWATLEDVAKILPKNWRPA